MPVHAYSITDACLRTHAGYFRIRNAILRGQLRGWKDADGRWQVDAQDLERFMAERRALAAAPAA